MASGGRKVLGVSRSHVNARSSQIECMKVKHCSKGRRKALGLVLHRWITL